MGLGIRFGKLAKNDEKSEQLSEGSTHICIVANAMA
jgi:hypothetical protein